MAEQTAFVIIAAFVTFVFTNLGWFLFRKKGEEKNEQQTERKAELDEMTPCSKLLLLEQALETFKSTTDKTFELHERRLNAHAQELDLFRDSLSRKEERDNERDKHLDRTLNDMKDNITKIMNFLLKDGMQKDV